MIDQNTIVSMAREAGMPSLSLIDIGYLEKFAALVAGAEREPLTAEVIQELADEGVFHGNVFEIVRRIEEEHGIFKLRAHGIGGEA